jgi:hypothetical protein
MSTNAAVACGVAAAIAIAFFWPVITPVSGRTTNAIRKQDASQHP